MGKRASMRYFQVCPLLFTLTAAHPQLYGWHRPVRTDGNGNTVVNVEHLDELVSDRHGHILKYFFQRKTWNAATKHCKDLGGTLPLIEDATKNLEVRLISYSPHTKNHATGCLLDDSTEPLGRHGTMVGIQGRER